MKITLTKKQDEKLSNLIQVTDKLKKEIEIVNIRQNEILDIILEHHSIDIKNVSNVNLVDGILSIETVEIKEEEENK